MSVIIRGARQIVGEEREPLFDNPEPGQTADRGRLTRVRGAAAGRRKEVVSMPGDPIKRVGNWDTAYDTAAIKAQIDKKRPDMLARMTAQTTSIVSMEAQVKQTVDALGGTVIEYPFYLCYGRELWHITHQTEMSGEAAAVEAELLIVKWVARGLTRSVLEAIRTQVFNIGPPSSP